MLISNGCKTGGRLTSFTTILNWLVALNGGVPVSVTTVVIRLVLGPWACVGVQVMTPFVSMTSPAGGLIRAVSQAENGQIPVDGSVGNRERRQFIDCPVVLGGSKEGPL